MFHNQLHEPEQEADLIDQNAEEVNAHHRHDRNLEDDPFAQIKEYGTQDDELQNSLTVADAKSEAASVLDEKNDVKIDAPEHVNDDDGGEVNADIANPLPPVPTHTQEIRNELNAFLAAERKEKELFDWSTNTTAQNTQQPVLEQPQDAANEQPQPLPITVEIDPDISKLPATQGIATIQAVVAYAAEVAAAQTLQTAINNPDYGRVQFGNMDNLPEEVKQDIVGGVADFINNNPEVFNPTTGVNANEGGDQEQQQEAAVAEDEADDTGSKATSSSSNK